MWSDTFKYPSEWTRDLESTKKNIEQIKARIRILMKSNEDLGELMDSEKAKVNQFYSGEKTNRENNREYGSRQICRINY